MLARYGGLVACNKEPYKTAAQAKSVRQWAGQKKARLRQYYCRECQSWHNTTRPDLFRKAA